MQIWFIQRYVKIVVKLAQILSHLGLQFYFNFVYSTKGAALMRMMEGFLTLGTLQKALQTYMKA